MAEALKASYRHRLHPPVEAAPPSATLVAMGLNDAQEPLHVHEWRRQPPELQPLAAENKLIWYCTRCNALKTLDSSHTP